MFGEPAIGCLIQRILRELLRSFLGLLNQALGTIPDLVRANLKLAARIADIIAEPILLSDERLKLSLEDIEKEFEIDLKRLARIEEKARATVIGVSLSVSLTMPGIALLAGTGALGDTGLKMPSAALLSAAVLFLLTSGFLALLGYKVGEVSRPQIRDHEPLVTPEERRQIILHCLDLNRLRILAKSNLLSASIDCLRNGLATILALLVVVVIAAL